MSQCEKILEVLQRGETVTPAYAYERFRSLALHSRIAELRERGYDIACTIQTDGGMRWGEYRLRGQGELAL